VPTALLSVYDKSGIAELAEGLHVAGWRVLSSGGTARAIAAGGVPVTDIAELTRFPAILGHRVVTLHPMVHGGILADTSDPSHRADLAEYGIDPIDLVVVNLYPFATDPGVDLIDVGGPAMVRAAAKNHDRVAVVVDPADYDAVLDEVRAEGQVTWTTRRSLARKAFATTSAYDAEIASWLDTDIGELSVQKSVRSAHQSGAELPPELHLSLRRAQQLRYGENPHQLGARYRFDGSRSWWDDAVQHGGKELSYLNLYDTEAAWRLVHRFDEPACVIVKHANPCGVAVAGEIGDAYVRANACDPVSAFGGIVAVNRAVSAGMAEALAPVFTEVVVAPDYEPDALTTLTARKNVRVLTAAAPSEHGFDVRPIDGGLLVQQPDPVSTERAMWRVVTTAAPTEHQWADLEFAWVVCAAVSSNAIVLANQRQAFGIGAGQQNRVDSARIAATRAGDRVAGGVCASDAFFPFRDGLDTVVATGVTAVIQPGGSVRDDEVIAAADEHGIAMVFTGERHFRH
jgi:phosphoribosylaminoimidazolecarboxamide formyltransferase / IMP cyclohydrolase